MTISLPVATPSASLLASFNLERAVTVALGNFVFTDLNDNGRYDSPTETGIGNVEVQLWTSVNSVIGDSDDIQLLVGSDGVTSTLIILTDNAIGSAIITATDSNLCTGSATLQINPFNCPTLSIPSNPPAPSLGTAYSYTFTASGGGIGAIYTWSATNLPIGLSLNSTTGQLTGTATTAGTATITATYTGPGGELCTVSIPLDIGQFCCPQLIINIP